MKCHTLIVHDNTVAYRGSTVVFCASSGSLDLFSSIFLIITYAVKISDVPLAGSLGYWICMIVLSEKLIWVGIIGSVINLAIITVERYVKVVFTVWSKRNVRKWMTSSY